jgi:hypothetical protein
MSLPKDFQFSQSSLQDFETCPRRFQLRYLQQLSWPAIESEPVQEAERLAQLGTDFHRLVHQHLVGIDEETLETSLSSAQPELKIWWQNYLQYHPTALSEAETYPEMTLSTPLRGFRLLARFDLLAVRADHTLLIIDWKTAQRKPSRDYLAQRIQTRVYPYVLATAGTAYNHRQPIDPTRIQMIYWYPAAPGQPEEFQYSSELFQRDEQILSDLIERIKAAAQNDDFLLVEDSKPCKYCVYRSFCDRGDEAGPLLELTEEPQETLDVSALDWDQIAEIQF